VEETRGFSRKGNFDALHLITEKYSTLRKYAPRMLSALQFMATPAAQALSDVDTITEMYRKQLRKCRHQRQQGLSQAGENWCSRLQASTASTTSFAY
jgi:hypothetical protein